MTPEQEQKVLETLYDRIFDIITYVPGGGKAGGFSKDTTFLQMTKNVVLNPADFQNAASSINPGGDLRSTFAFSDMVDVVPTVSAEWSDSTTKVSDTYKQIVDGANTDNKVDPEQQSTYDLAYDFLNTITEIPNFQGPPTKNPGPSAIALAYDQNETSYINAVMGFRTAYNGYNLELIEDQRQFQAVAPGLQNNIDQAWNKWNREGKASVEQAQNALLSTINDAVSNAIARAQAAMADANKMAALDGSSNGWFASYAMPTNWADLDCEGSQLSLKSSFLNTKSSKYASDYSSHSKGIFWFRSESSSGSVVETGSSMEASDFELSAELITVRIRRPWLNTLLFRIGDWWVKGYSKNQISNGAIAGNEDSVLPLIPTAFIVARNVKIKSNFSAQDQSRFVKEDTSRTSRGWGWGPFNGGGTYTHSRQENDTFSSSYSGGTLTLPGLQLIGWVSSITPPCPPKDHK